MVTTTTPQARTPTPVTTAATRPVKMKRFLAKIRAMLIIFDDQISSLDEGRATAYETFIMAYKDTFADIWPKINGADITILLQSVKDTKLQELRRLSQILCPDKTKPTLVQEKRNIPTLDNILGSLVNRIPEQKLPDKETCSLISTIFSDLAEAHKHYANMAKGLADIAGLISPEQLTLVLAAAVPPTLQLVLPPGQILPLSTPPPPPDTSTTATGRQELIKYCKNKILPDPSAAVFETCEACTPTRVLATAVFCTLEKHLFDETTPRAEVASSFVLQPPSYINLSPVLITRVAHTHTRRNARQRTQPALPVKLKKQPQVHLRYHKTRHEHRKHLANPTTMTQKQGQSHRKTPCLQPVQIPFTTHLNNFRAVFFSHFSVLIIPSTFIAGCNIISLVQNIIVYYFSMYFYIYFNKIKTTHVKHG